MANRYWVGGSGTWNTTSTTNWSASSGGASGASVPTAADSVFFDQAGTYTVTCTGALTCLDITVSAGTVTFASGTTPTFAISGSMSLIAGTVWSSGGAITFNATTTGKTITTNGTSLSGSVTLNGVGGAWTLGSALTLFGINALTVTNGTFDTANYNFTGGSISSSNSNTRTITLGSSTVTLSSGTPVIFTTSTNLTFNAGTSQLNLSSGSAGFAGGGLTYYNVSFTGNPSTGSQIRSITGANTFNDLTLLRRTTADLTAYSFTANQTINGTLTFSATTDATTRIAVVPQSNWGYAATLGVTRTLTCNAVSGLTDVDFMDIAFAGNCISGGNLTGTRLGDMKGNSGITFTAGTTKYWNLAAGGNWNATAWATTSGGSPAINNLPLAQDTCVFEATGLNSGASVNLSTLPYALGTIDMSARTSNTMTFNMGSGAPFIFGNFINGTGVTLTGTNGITFGGRGAQSITSAGKTWGVYVNINSPSGTVTLQDAFTSTAGTCFLINGTLNLNNLTWTCSVFSQSGANGSPVIAFGTSNITLTGSGTVFTGSTSTTVTGTPNVYLTYSGASSVAIAAGSSITEANSINFIITAGSYPLTTTSNHVVRTLDFSNGGTSTYTGNVASSAVTIYGDLICKTGMTWTAGASVMTFATTSGTKTITSAGLTIDRPMNFNGVGGTWQIQDALNIGSNTLTLTNGTFDANIYNVTAGALSSNNSNTRTIAIGSGTWTLSGAGTTVSTAPWGIVTSGAATGLTVTGTGTLSFTSASTKTFFGGAATYPTLNQGGAGTLQIGASANTFTNITATYTATGATTISFPTGATQTVSSFTAGGAATRLLTLNSSTAGTRATIAYSGSGTISTGDYLNVQDIAFTPAVAADGTTPYVWYLGANSTNSGNNTGGLFQAGGAGALKVYQITNTATTSWTVPSDWNSSSNTIHLIGGGGGGGGSRATSTTNKAGGAGGGGGGYRVVTNYSTTPSSSITVAVGAGGTAGASSGGTGGTGGTTSWATTNTATGGTGGSTTTTPTSVGGTGGSGTYSGGTGGAGSTTTTSGVIATGGGGGGAAGPNGAGGAGGIGFADATVANTAGGGGGGNGGGSAGGNASSATGGTGGNNFGGTGGGASNTAGTIGGGGGGGVSSIGRSGGTGIDILNTTGGGGGSGGPGGSGYAGLSGIVYGAGGSGGSGTSTTGTATGGAGGQGLIVIAYTPSAGVASNTNFFMMFN